MVLYLIFKAIATGAMLLAALLWGLGHSGPLITLAAPALSLLFIVLTAIVLVIDLERPERFHYILTRPNWRSWLVWGAYFLTAHGALSALWLAAAWFRWQGMLDVLAAPVAVVSVLATSYTGFLFAQGLARDLWQGPGASIDLIAQSGAAGAASLLIASAATGADPAAVPVLWWALAISIAAHLVILAFEHLLAPSPTRHHELAVQTIRRGRYAPLFWGVAMFAGGLVPLAMLIALGPGTGAALTCTTGLLALAGGAAWEYIWVEAGQSVPLS